MKKFFTRSEGETLGPFDEDDLRLLNISKETLLWHDGIESWTKAGELSELNDYFRNSDSYPKDQLNYDKIKNSGVDLKKRKEISRSRLIIWLLVSCLILLGGSFYYYYYINKNNSTENNARNYANENHQNYDDSKNSTVKKSDGEKKSTTSGSSGATINDKFIPVYKVEASSYMKSSGILNFYPENVTDEQLDSWWSPETNQKNNCWIKIIFQNSYEVSSIEIVPGSHFSNYPNYGNLWTKNNRISQLVLEFSNGTNQVINLSNQDVVQSVGLQKVTTSYIILKPLSWSTGSEWDDICISWFKAQGRNLNN